MVTVYLADRPVLCQVSRVELDQWRKKNATMSGFDRDGREWEFYDIQKTGSRYVAESFHCLDRAFVW